MVGRKRAHKVSSTQAQAPADKLGVVSHLKTHCLSRGALTNVL